MSSSRGRVVDVDDERREEHLEAFDIRFIRPEHWLDRAEREEAGPTFLYWNENAGSFRMTPMRIGRSVAAFVSDTLASERARGHAPEPRAAGTNRFLTWQTENEQTRTRFFLAGHGDRIVLCSYAHGLELLADELDSLELEGDIEALDELLASLRIAEHPVGLG